MIKIGVREIYAPREGFQILVNVTHVRFEFKLLFGGLGYALGLALGHALRSAASQVV